MIERESPPHLACPTLQHAPPTLHPETPTLHPETPTLHPEASTARQYGVCDDKVSIWKDYNQGGKAITTLECRFGEQVLQYRVQWFTSLGPVH